ncbi:MAG: radical SAM protein [Planctomycetota bacterium]|nr:radical SAM protein [Planctomycetota bacterium]
MDLKVTEIFHSIQGESTYSGLPCTFIRLATCDLRCRWCDTEYSFAEGETRSIDSILQRVREIGCPLVEVTGGEPLVQAGAIDLLRRLLEEEYRVLLETGGHRSLGEVPPEVVKIVDLKCPGSRMSHRNHWANLELLTDKDELKFVIANEEDYLWARGVLRDRQLEGKLTVLFSPVWGEMDPQELASWILRDRLSVRLQVQVHKVIWGPDRRGV